MDDRSSDDDDTKDMNFKSQYKKSQAFTDLRKRVI